MGLFDFFRKKPIEEQGAKPTAIPSRKEFARVIMDGLQTAGAEGLAYQENEYCVTIAQPPLRFFLNNAYDEYLAAPDAPTKEQIVQRYVSQMGHGLPATPDDWEDVKESVLPLVRSRSFLEKLAAQLNLDSDKNVQWRPIGDSLGLCVGHDTPQSLSYVNTENFRKWNVTFETALAQALENLSARSREPFVEVQPGLYRSPWKDCYDASRIVIPEIFQQLPIAGSPVVTVPHWNVLFVADSENAEALCALGKLTEEEIQQPRSNHTEPLILATGGWQPFLPPAGTPAHAALLRVRKIAYIRNCAEETAHLNKRFEKEGRDIFVANIHAVQHNVTGEITTTASWADGVLTLLPRVDRIGLGDLKQPKDKQFVGWVAWDDLAAVTPGLREPAVTTYPPYYEVQHFPPAEQLQNVPRKASLS